MRVAESLGDVHLVSVDSMQVYRGMDIGTAKPSEDDQRRVPHHCLDLVDPTQEFTVADYRSAFRAALRSIGEADRSALLVGGTGLYHRVVIDDLDIPGKWPEVREALESEPDTAALFERLVRADPDAATKIEPANRRRIMRALEVTIGSGRPFSSFGPGLDSYPRSAVVQIGIRRSRDALGTRIEQRVGQMIAEGLVEEVRGLRRSGLSRTAGQALGYKEILAYLGGEIGKDEAIDLIITRTRQFAVRQERWFRRDPRIRWIDVADDLEPVVKHAIFVLESSP